MVIKKLPPESLELNEGQLEGLPNNPRVIKDKSYRYLIKSLKDDPEMLDVRPLIVWQGVVIAGNMRLRGVRELKWKEVSTITLPKSFPIEKIRAIAIKDNNPYGDNDWDVIANEWSDFPIEEWGMWKYETPEFEPGLEPSVSGREVTDGDIQNAEDGQAGRFNGPSLRPIDMICPHCGKEFQIHNPS